MNIKQRHHGICELAMTRINTHAANEWHRMGTTIHHDGTRRAVLPWRFLPGGAVDDTLAVLVSHRNHNAELTNDHFIVFTIALHDTRHDRWKDALPITDGDTRDGQWKNAISATSQFHLDGIGYNRRDIVMALPPHADPCDFDGSVTFQEFVEVMDEVITGGAYVVNIAFTVDA